MKILDVLHGDHEEVGKMLDKLVSQCDTSDDDVKKTFAKIKTALEEHTNGEEQTFYPALTQVDGIGDLVQRARSQHESIDSILQRLTVVVDGEDFETMRRLSEDLRVRVVEHVSFEETELFPCARNMFSEAESNRLGDDMLKLEPTGHPVRSKIAEIRS